MERIDASEYLKRKALTKVLDVVKRGYEDDLTPAEMGTDRYDTIGRFIDIKQGYDSIKISSDEEAKQILEKLKMNIRSSRLEERFNKALFWVASANAMDFGVLDHRFSISDFEAC